MADRPGILRLIGGFRGRLIQWVRTKCCGADPCCHGNENLANLGYFFHKNRFFFFVFFFFFYFWVVSSPYGTLQNVVLRFFDLGPLTPKIYSPKYALAQNHL